MAKQYKRSVCAMCPIKTDCDQVRWAAVCGACPDSLKCAAGPGIGHDGCTKFRAAWLDLPRKCLLVSHLLNQKANEGVDLFYTENANPVCPRCGQHMGSIYVDHALNHMFRRVTKYIFSCDFCGVDETLELA